MNSGKDKNGIYYFGKKRMPINWKDYNKAKEVRKKGVVEMKLREGFDDEVRRYFEVDSKQINDYDGFLTDYTMYEEYVIPKDEWFDFLRKYKGGSKSPYELMEKWFNRYVFVFGDKELYDPNDGYDEFDYECESDEEAYEWFNNYDGFDDEDEVYESLTRPSESVVDEYGQFTMLDDEVGNFEGNMPEEDIDKALVYLQKVSKLLKAPLSKIVYYRCNEDYLDPTNQKSMFDLTRIYNKNKYDGYDGTVNGKKFIVDHFDTRAEFGMYATDEETIIEVIEQMEQSY